MPASDAAPSVPWRADPDPIRFAKLVEAARFSADNFACVPLFAGDSVVGDLYCFEPGGSLAAHRHEETEHVLTAIQGEGDVRVGSRWVVLRQGETVLVPRGLYHGVHNSSTARLLVQQVSSPKPWDARYHGPRPSEVS